MKTLAPHNFDDGSFCLQFHHIALWAQSVNADKIPGLLPSIAVLVAFRGAGASISDIMDHLGTAAQHVLFGELAIDILHPFEHNKLYHVKTQIMSSERKVGRKSGDFDRVKLSYSISDSDKTQKTAVVTQTWIVARPQEADLAA